MIELNRIYNDGRPDGVHIRLVGVGDTLLA